MVIIQEAAKPIPRAVHWERFEYCVVEVGLTLGLFAALHTATITFHSTSMVMLAFG
jgi:hypothetical protein